MKPWQFRVVLAATAFIVIIFTILLFRYLLESSVEDIETDGQTKHLFQEHVNSADSEQNSTKENNWIKQYEGITYQLLQDTSQMPERIVTMDYSDAVIACESLGVGYTLLTLKSQDESDFITDWVYGHNSPDLNLKEGKEIWLSIKRKGRGKDAFEWPVTDNTEVNLYRNWHFHEPSGGWGEGCVEMRGWIYSHTCVDANTCKPEAPPGQWNDINCSKSAAVICQSK